MNFLDLLLFGWICMKQERGKLFDDVPTSVW